MDATIILNVAKWVVAELYRLNFNVPPEEAQQLIDSIVVREIPLLFQIGNTKRVLYTSLSYRDKAMLLLYSEDSFQMMDSELISNLEYKNSSRFKSGILSHSTVPAFSSTMTLVPRGKGGVASFDFKKAI